MKIKVGDTVKVVIGKDKGREAKVEKTFPKESKLLLPGINIYKKHFKGSQGQKGGIYDIPRALNVAKVALVCPSCKKITRVGYKVIDGEKVRICRKCSKEIKL